MGEIQTFTFGSSRTIASDRCAIGRLANSFNGSIDILFDADYLIVLNSK